MEEYMSGKKASEVLGVYYRTLYQWDKKKLIETIRTPGGKRLYNVKKYLSEHNKNITNVKKVNITNVNKIINEGLNIIYARVSSANQKNDLERQIKFLKEKYPNHKLVTDIASGLNFKRKGLSYIIDNAIKGRLKELIVVHKDRLCRFGYELIERLIKIYSGGKIIILDKKDKKEPEEEIVEDVIHIMNVFVAKVNGMRKYKKQR